MKILITGGAGYLGSVLTEVLLLDGHSVTVLDNLLYNQATLFNVCHYPGFEFLLGDARDEELMAGLVAKHDAIIPLAAIVGAPACQLDYNGAWSTNLDTVRILEKLITSQLVIFPTTNSGYGISTGDTYCTEQTPMKPISIYGQSKVNAESVLLDSGKAVTLRLATVFGMSPRMRLDLLVNDFTFQAVKHGTIKIFERHFKRNFVHIRDVADCFVYCLENFNDMKGEPYNVGLDSANLSKEELAFEIKKQVPALILSLTISKKTPTSGTILYQVTS